jgi:hypothetical protein
LLPLGVSVKAGSATPLVSVTAIARVFIFPTTHPEADGNPSC